MSLTKLTQETWIDGKQEEIEIVDPGWEQVKAAIDLFDAESDISIFLDGSDGSQMQIGGRRENYLVSLFFTEDEGISLINKETDPGQELQMAVGGQVGDFPLHILVDYSRVLSAAHWYFDYLTANPSLDWSGD